MRTLLLVSIAVCFSACSGQIYTMDDMLGTWHLHRYYVDNGLLLDVDLVQPFPTRDFEMMKELASKRGVAAPDSDEFSESLHRNEKSYRGYELVLSLDSSFSTKLDEGMSNPLPKEGRLRMSESRSELQMLSEIGYVVIDSMSIKEGSLHLFQFEPFRRELVFRR